MDMVDLSGLPLQILTSKDETVLLAGIRWEELILETNMIRLSLAHPDGHVRYVFLPMDLRLPVQGDPAGIMPKDLSPQEHAFRLNEVLYALFFKTEATWGYFQSTHEF